jgi:hypothetical protein
VTGAGALLLAGLLVAPLALAAVGSEADYETTRTAASRDGLLAADEAAWSGATEIAWGPDRYRTTFRAQWSDEGLYLLWDATDPDPWHTMTKRDEHIWEEEVVEIFLDLDGSGHDYYELEVNPVNVVCDLRMVSPWPNQKGDIDFDLEGLETRVHPRTDESGATTGWTATAFLPWTGLAALPSAEGVAIPPRPGDAWRFNVFRIKRPGGPTEPTKDAVFAAWSPPSGRSFHDAGAFRPFRFAGGR